MTEPQQRRAGSPYEQAVAFLNGSSHLPQVVIIDPMHVLWVAKSPKAVSPGGLKLLDAAAGVLAALHSKQVQVAVASVAEQPHQFKEELAGSLKGLLGVKLVVETPAASHRARTTSGSSSSSSSEDWAHLLQSVKTATGTTLQQSLLVSGTRDVVMAGRKAGCLAVTCPPTGLSPELLHNALEQYASKFEDDRGY